MVRADGTTQGRSSATIDGNEATARVAHALSEIVVLYPITPASPMGEYADSWTGEGRTNLWGSVPAVVEMQSEAGAAGALHGAAMKGALATTFTSSQGLLLMLPNMFKMAGELTPAVIHVAARAIATHALSIFGDHSDVMAARSTGWAMLAASSVQESHDFALISHAATLRTRVPFMHFFDGFRTSHEIDKIDLLSDADLQALVSEQDILAHRSRSLTPDHPTLRGTAQNPDVFFQGREASNPFYERVPIVVQEMMDELAVRTGRQYRLAEYEGAPDAERVVVLMGSGVGAVQETVEELNRRGEKVGLLKLRLFRPFPTSELLALLPPTVQRVCVLDRTKEPGAVADPLFLDVVTALYESGRRDIDVIAGRYGLGSKEFTPRMVKGVFDELAATKPRRRLTVGIVDDVSGGSVTPDASFDVPTRALQAVFFGLGSDGTVGANKNSIKIIGELTDLHAQGYFVYDSRKSGSVTVSHLRFGPEPIRSTYLVESADFVACHQFNLLRGDGMLDIARDGATLLLNAPYPTDEVWDRLPVDVRRQIIEKRLDVWVINAGKVARAAGMGGRINTVMQPCFFALSNVIPRDEALKALKESIEHTYVKRGPVVVQRNLDAVSHALEAMFRLEVPAGAEVLADTRPAARIMSAPVLTRELVLGHGELLPVSAVPIDGIYPTATARFEKRAIGTELPIWDASICIDCGKCAIVCPHAAIRMKAYDPADLVDAPDGFKSKDCVGRDLVGFKLTVQVSPDDCTGCGVCVDVCPAHSKEMVKHKSINLGDAAEHRDHERPQWDFFEQIPEMDRTKVKLDTVKGSQLLQPLFEFSGACAGCGETPYLKLLSQLFGDRMVVANATGCSSIYGGNLPTTPWSSNASGRGPAWANSLFEDNAEFGLGLRLAYEQHATEATRLLHESRDLVGDDVASAIVYADQSDEAGIIAQRGRVDSLKTALAEAADATRPDINRLLSIADDLVDKSFWIVGGDGWAYDIGFGGLDHVLGSGRDVNVLVLDTEVYSNTGGQSSKSTPRGAVAKFAASGKATAKKDLGAFARSYGNVYVAQIALGANEMQTVRALREAAAWPGPSLVIAYSTCIAHGIEMSTSMSHQKDAVSSGYWPLYRYHPSPKQDAHPFQLDSKRPTMPLTEFALAETRFSMLARSEPERSRHLLALAQSDIDERWRYYEGLAGVARVLPHTPVDTDSPVDADAGAETVLHTEESS
jgi:pyruvate-ferredoxin/flavodoxin oxidoreductase